MFYVNLSLIQKQCKNINGISESVPQLFLNLKRKLLKRCLTFLELSYASKFYKNLLNYLK